MKRKINVKAVLIIIAIPVAILLLRLIGWGVAHINYPNDPDFWLVVHNQPILNDLTNGFLSVFIIGFSICVILLIGYGIYKLFNWIFPKVETTDEIKRGN